MKKRRFIAGLVFALFLCACDEKADPWEYSKPPIAGNEVPVTPENIIGTWQIAGLYSEQKDLTAINPTLRSGYLTLRGDDSCFFCMNEKMASPVLKGIYSTANIADRLLILEMKENDVVLPRVRLTINTLTDIQMDADYLYYNPQYGKGESDDSMRLLASFGFDNGSLSPDYAADDISVSDVEIVGITVEQQNDTTMCFAGFLANVNQQNSKNLHFKLKSLTDKTLSIDSFYVKGYRLPTTINNSKVQFCTSVKTSNDFVNNGSASFDLPKDGTQAEKMLAAASTAAGDSIFVGLTSNVLGTNGGLVYINNIAVYGRLILGEKFLYNYVFEKQ
ncbi:MAG: hypothetical protein LBR34_02735 [Prevotella sp.]|jgi:hypothetical protein|nr:hypothetical protein [Prevotella sp.]